MEHTATTTADCGWKASQTASGVEQPLTFIWILKANVSEQNVAFFQLDWCRWKITPGANVRQSSQSSLFHKAEQHLVLKVMSVDRWYFDKQFTVYFCHKCPTQKCLTIYGYCAGAKNQEIQCLLLFLQFFEWVPGLFFRMTLKEQFGEMCLIAFLTGVIHLLSEA